MKNQIPFDAFLESVGRRRFEEAIGVSTQVVTRAIKENVMPAHWFLDVRDWCVANKFDVPEHLFRWEPKSRSKQNVNSHPDIQPASRKQTVSSGGA